MTASADRAHPAFKLAEQARGHRHRRGLADDLGFAKAVATSVLEDYGDEDALMWERFKTEGIWGDHAAVQAVMAALRVIRLGGMP